jgi:hypothetical protein
MTNDFYAVSQLVAEFQDKLKVIVERDGSRHMMDAPHRHPHDGFA